MIGNERIVHPVPRIVFLALLGIAIAIAFTLAQVTILRAIGIPSTNSSTEPQSSIANESSYSDSSLAISSPFSETPGQLSISARLTLLTINMGIVCTAVIITALWFPRIMQRYLFGRTLNGIKRKRAPRKNGAEDNVFVSQSQQLVPVVIKNREMVHPAKFLRTMSADVSSHRR